SLERGRYALSEEDTTPPQHLEPGRSGSPHRLLPDSVSSHGIDDALRHGGTACRVDALANPRLPTHLAHPLKDARAVVIHALGPPLQGSWQNRGEPCRLLPADIPGLGSVVVTTRRLCTINTRAPFNHVEIDLQNAPLAEDEFGHRYQCELRTLAEDRAARSEEYVLYKLLRNGGSSASATAFQIVFGSDLDLVPIEPMVLVEARVLRGDNSVLEIGRDLAERNEFVAFAIRSVVNPGLQAALEVHRGCRWVDPPGGQKDQRGKRPNKHHADGKPSNKGPEEARPKRGLGGCIWHYSHISE